MKTLRSVLCNPRLIRLWEFQCIVLSAMAILGGLPASAEDSVTRMRFENPVIRTDWPDPTFWTGGDGQYYGVASGLKEIRASRDLVRWEPIGIVEEPETKRSLDVFTSARWAPDAVRIGGEWRIYVTQFISSDTNRLVCLSSENPRGPFRFRGVILNNWDYGIRDLAIDAEVLTDEGRVWLFTGSVAGGVYRLELTPDGLSVKNGRPVHVAGLLPGDRDRAWIYSNPCYEGAYLHRRGGWWYLFVSAGSVLGDSYHLCCGRSRTLEGEFVDANGVSLAKGGGTTLLVSNTEFPGPGHNGDIFTDALGRDYMFFHSHWSAFPPETAEHLSRRCLNLQRIRWNEAGWPYFDGGTVQKTEERPVLSKAEIVNPQSR